MKIKFLILIFVLLLVLPFALGDTTLVNPVNNVCCEKTTYGASCQNAPADQCDNGINPITNASYQQAPTSCESTSFCKQGCCYDSDEGICMENTPKKVCQESNGVWSEDNKCNIPQCTMGCCILGKEASFVGLTRCKKLSSFYGLTTDFRQSVKTEDACIALAQASDEGACVYQKDYETTCKFTSRQDCKEVVKTPGVTNTTVKFYKDYLCSNPDLATKCGPSEKTTCIDGKDEVYFLDTCGNPANIYDDSKKNDSAYWSKIVPKASSCNANSDNSNSKTCGNCDYFMGSMCKKYDSGKDSARANTGDNVCRNLDCKTTTLGKPMKHGESWCSFDSNTVSSSGSIQYVKGSIVGSQYIRHICEFGEEIIEPCADYRQEQCIQDSIPYTENGVNGQFSQAGCRVNRWQDCFTQTEQSDCENSDKRDCYWIADASVPKASSTTASPPGVQASPVTGYSLFGGSDSSSSSSSLTATLLRKGACLPLIAPGLKFWDSNADATSICKQTSMTAIVTCEKKGLLTAGGWNCNKGDQYEDPVFVSTINEVCRGLGDCGASVNIAGKVTSGGFNWNDDGSNMSLESGYLSGIKSAAKLRDLGSSSSSSSGKGGIWGWT